jgi:hypothetical protein
MGGVVIRVVGMDQLVDQLQIAVRVDLLEGATREPLVVVGGHAAQVYPILQS